MKTKIFSSFVLISSLLSASIQLSSGSYCGSKGEAIQVKCEPITINLEKYNYYANVPLTLEHIMDKMPHFVIHRNQKKSAKVCSVVSHSESLLDCYLGSEIDSAEAVYRIGFAPLAPYATYAGTKVNFTLCRALGCRLERKEVKDMRGFRKGDEYKSASILLLKPLLQKTSNRKKRKMVGKDTVIWEPSTFKFDIAAMATGLNHSFRTLNPTTGFHLGVDLLSSGRCKAVHMYGIGGGLRRYTFAYKPDKYATTKQKNSLLKRIKLNHSTQLENLIIDRLKVRGHDIVTHSCRR